MIAKHAIACMMSSEWWLMFRLLIRHCVCKICLYGCINSYFGTSFAFKADIYLLNRQVSGQQWESKLNYFMEHAKMTLEILITVHCF